MNTKFEIDPDLLVSAVEIMRDAQAYYIADACALSRIADACALSRIGGESAMELARERLQSAKTAETLLYFFGTR